MNEVITKEISKNASQLLSAINRGNIPLNDIKQFLAKVGEVNSASPLGRKATKKQQRIEELDRIIK